MKPYSLRSLVGKIHVGVIFLLLMLGCFQTARASVETSAIDSAKAQIRHLLVDQNYVQAATAYGHLGWLYHQRYGYNKYTMDCYFNSLKYCNLTGDSLGYYNQHIVIGDYYTHDYFMQSYAE